jgi:hypothetical protein
MHVLKVICSKHDATNTSLEKREYFPAVEAPAERDQSRRSRPGRRETARINGGRRPVEDDVSGTIPRCRRRRRINDLDVTEIIEGDMEALGSDDIACHDADADHRRTPP